MTELEKKGEAREAERQARGRKVLEDEYAQLGGSLDPRWSNETSARKIKQRRDERKN